MGCQLKEVGTKPNEQAKKPGARLLEASNPPRFQTHSLLPEPLTRKEMTKEKRDEKILEIAVSLLVGLKKNPTPENIITIAKAIKAAYDSGWIERGLHETKTSKGAKADGKRLIGHFKREAERLSGIKDLSYKG